MRTYTFTGHFKSQNGAIVEYTVNALSFGDAYFLLMAKAINNGTIHDLRWIKKVDAYDVRKVEDFSVIIKTVFKA
jgi:phage-related protein